MSQAAVIVTRAEPGCGETAARLQALGYRPIESPAITLAPVTPPPAIALEGVQGLLFTSANGVRAMVAWAAEAQSQVQSQSKSRPQSKPFDVTSLKAWCVGPATLAAARAAGFDDAVSADGDAADLEVLVRADAAPGAGRLVHVANTAAAGTLVSRLRASGFDAAFAGLYAPQRASHLAPEAADLLARGGAFAVLFHSARGADGFATLAGALDRGDVSGAVAVAVSAKAMSPVLDLGWRTCAVASRPNEDALLASLERAMGSV